jgi:hypothetical protein
MSSKSYRKIGSEFLRGETVAHSVQDCIHTAKLRITVFRKGFLYALATEARNFGQVADPFDSAHHAQGSQERGGLTAFCIFIKEDRDVIIKFFGMIAEVFFFNLADSSIVAYGLDTPAKLSTPESLFF